MISKNAPGNLNILGMGSINQSKPKTKQLAIAERRNKIAQILHEDPSTKQVDLAEQLGVNIGTISRDIKAITEQIQLQTTEVFEIYFQRELNNIEEKQHICEDRITRLHKNAHQGSRWMEEWTKLQALKIRMLGLNAPEKFLVRTATDLTKEERDAAFKAAIGIDYEEIDEAEIDEANTKELPLLQ